ARFLDRAGKGIRTSPRDALIADTTDPRIHGRAFGVQRAMDHAGAVMGPLVCAALLALGVTNRQLFFYSAIPAFAVVFVIGLFVHEKAVERTKVNAPKLVWSSLSSSFKSYLFCIFAFSLGNCSDGFLLLRLNDVGLNVTWIAILWSAHHVVKMT